ncbi:MAG TPA: methyltransferase domain-containing protein [Haliangiales bacterium]|nr:methyltransferase domain-containing protein [Haliangiales bacterium]
MDSRERFSATADAYRRYRPGYPAPLLDWIAATTGAPPDARVADIGCGTGISSRFLATRGFRVVGVEPNADMLAHARAAGGGPTYVRGEAARTGLPDASVDLVTAAQAFHWFELEPTLVEIRRIAVPGAWMCAFWNVRVATPFNDEYERILHAYSSEYAPLSDTLDPRDAIRAAVAGTVCTEMHNDEALAWDAVLGRARSASYVAHGVADLAGFERELRAAYERHARPDGTLVWALRTVAAAWPA